MKIFGVLLALFAASLVQSQTLLDDFNAKYDRELTDSLAAHVTLVDKVIARYAKTAKIVKRYQTKIFKRLLNIPTVPRTIGGDFKRRAKNLRNKMSYDEIKNVFLIPATAKIEAVRAQVATYNNFSSNPLDICYKMTDFKAIWDAKEYLVQLTLISRFFDDELTAVEKEIEALIVSNEKIFVNCNYAWTCISAEFRKRRQEVFVDVKAAIGKIIAFRGSIFVDGLELFQTRIVDPTIIEVNNMFLCAGIHPIS